MDKKADLTINYIFLIFVSTIAVFVVVGLITGWSFNIKNIMERIGDPEKPEVIDTKIVEVGSGDTQRYITEIVKQAKICNDRAIDGEVHGELCYAIICSPSSCSASCVDIQDDIQYHTDRSSYHRCLGILHRVKYSC